MKKKEHKCRRCSKDLDNTYRPQALFCRDCIEVRVKDRALQRYYDNKKYIKVSVRITQPQKKFIDGGYINLSKFVRVKLDEVIPKPLNIPLLVK